jgi:protein-S-isoprenylcysteine O-methyltransferase Ste14
VNALIYALHAMFYTPFAVRWVAQRAGSGGGGGTAVDRPIAAKGARTMLVWHMAGFGVLYFGIGDAIFGGALPLVFPAQRLAGAAVIVVGTALAAWTMWVFHSWRFTAELDRGHRLSTDGPFRYVRHPIYAALDLLALGSALWAPSPIVLAGALAVTAGGDVRARAEEALLVEAFGDAYRDYMKRVRRFLPFVY